MLNEMFVKAIADKAVEAAGVQSVGVTNAENGRYLRIYDRKSGKMELVRSEPAARRDTVQRVEDVVALVNRRLDGVGASAGSGPLSGEVFVGDGAIVGVFTEGTGHRDHSVTMPLHVNPAFERLMEIAGADEVQWMSHAAFVELLRVDMAGCVELSDMKLWKSLKFAAQTKGASNIKVGNESIDKSIQLGTTTEDGVEIPEFIGFALPVYDECATDIGGVRELRRWGVTCSIAVDTLNQKFAVRPMTDELERARREAKQWLIEALKGVKPGVLVVTGSPG